MSNRASFGTWIAIIIVILLLVPVGFWWFVRHDAPAPGLASIAPATSSTAPAAPMHPISQARTALPAASSSASLPPLDSSDSGARASLNSLLGDSPLQHLLAKSDIIARIVATVDALPHQKLGRNILPIQPPKGVFATTQQAGSLVVSARNVARYQPYMDWIDSVQTDALVAWYVRHYPQFQQAYRQQGYPTGYFNDRLIAVIDHLLATPTPTKPIVLTQPHVLYEFANPNLQALSAGQKMLLRVGPANEAKIKTKLRAIRAALTGVSLPAAASSAAGV